MRILLCGYGKMGHMLAEIIESSSDLHLAGIIDADNAGDFSDAHADVAIDFSNPDGFAALSEFIRRTGTALVSGTTGFSDGGAAVRDLGQYAPVVYAENYSIGVNATAKATRMLSELLGDNFEVELTETHHRYKVDAPSGTAQMLLRAVDPEGDARLVYGRAPGDGPRQAGDIGVHSLRGGTVPGEHVVSFYGEDEVVSIKHVAFSRRVFAQGAIEVARRLVDAPRGSYSFDEIMERDPR